MSPRLHKSRPVSALACVLAVFFVARAEGADQAVAAASGSRRVVAVGDIHGAFNGMREILRKVELIDPKDRWVGGDAILVQTGDILDRGPGVIKAARLLMELQEQAPEQGGEVIVLLGNHEILNLFGDLRDVTKYILRNQIDGHSEKRLTVSCNDYAAFYRRLYERRREKSPKRRELIERCLAEQQLGLVEYLKEIGPDGHVGRWLRRLPTAVRVGDVVFVHGGLSAELAGRDLEEINREVRLEIQSFDQTRQLMIDQGWILPTTGMADVVALARQVAATPEAAPVPPHIRHVAGFNDWLTIREDGPLWFRGYATWSEDEGRAQLPGILTALGAEHVVVGHTPQLPFHILSRFDARVFLIDTGMLTSFYKGHPSALDIQGGSFTAFYLTRQDLLYQQREVATR